MTACVVPSRPSLFLQDCGELTLRVHGSGHDGRLIRIRSPKCTIGSAAGCTLRLVASGVAPLHCWVLRGREATIVRRLHGPVALNGGALCESALSPGDRLQVGTVELEVVECNRPAPPAAPELFAIPPVDTAELERELAAAMEKITRLEGESRQGWQSSITAAERADQLRTALADAHHQLDDACRELAATQATMQRQSAELQELRGALTAAEQADDQHAELLDRTQLESAALREEQGRLLTELSETRSALSGALEERSRLTARVAETEQRLAAHVAETQQRLAAEQQRWQEEKTQLERRLKQRDAELAALREESTKQTGVMTIAMTQLRQDAELSQEQWQAKFRDLQQQLEASRADLARSQQDSTGQQADQSPRATEQFVAGTSVPASIEDPAATRVTATLRPTEQFATLEQQMAQLRGQLADREQQLAAANEQLAALAAAAGAGGEAGRQLEELTRQQTALAECQAALTAREAALSGQQAEANKLHERLEQQSAELERKLEAASSRTAELETLRSQLADQRDALGERAERLAQRELAAAGAAESQHPAAADPCGQLEASEARCRQLASQVEILELRCRELEEQRQTAMARAAAAYRDAAAEVGALIADDPGVAAPGEGEAAASEEQACPSMTVAFQPQQQATISFPVTAPDTARQGTNPRDTASVASVLGRLVRSGVRRNSEPRPAPAAPAEPECPPAASAASESPASNTAVVPAEDESIDNYMDRLLKRVRGEMASQTGAWKQQPAAPASAVASAPAAIAPTPATESEPAGEYVPRTAAPEQTLGLSAMRDLANTAARDAIDIHIRKHTGRQAVSRLVTATLIIATSSALGYWAWRVHSLPAGIGAGVGVTAGLLWTLAALRRIVIVMRLNRQRPQTAPFPAAKPALDGESPARPE